MKKVFLFPVLILAVAFTACGPAAENRDKMVSSSKHFQDSIATMLKSSMEEAAIPGPNIGRPAPPPANPAAAQPAAGQPAAQPQPANPNQAK